MRAFEERVASGLRAAADAAPEASGQLASVKRAGRRRTLMSRAGVFAAAVAVTLVAVGPVAVLRQSQDGEIAAVTLSTDSTLSAPVVTTVPPATTGVGAVDPASVSVGLSEYGLDLETWSPLAQAEGSTLPPRPEIDVSATLLANVQSAAAEILTDIEADPPYHATLVQQAGFDQFVLIEHADGSCLTVIEHPRVRPQQNDLRGCVPPSGPVAWKVGDLNLIVWWGLSSTATLMGAFPDCGPAVTCIGEEASVLEGVAVLPTRYSEGVSVHEHLPVHLTAYDDEGAEVATGTIVFPPRQVVAEEGRIITLDGQVIEVRMPQGMEFDAFAVERGGLIRVVETGVAYAYFALNRTEHETADQQVPPGELSAIAADTGERGTVGVAIGLERGTVLVTLPDQDAVIDPAVWSGAFVDLVGDGEQTLVVAAGPGFEMLSILTPEQSGSSAGLFNGEGLIEFSTGGCFFDLVAPDVDGADTPEDHDRVGPLLRDGDNAVWCSGDITVSVVGPEAFVESMLAELTFAG